MDVDRIFNNDKQMHAVTGLTRQEVNAVIFDFEKELEAIGKIGPQKTGRPSKYGVKGSFLMLMMYYRHYLTFDAMGALFDLDNSNVKRWIEIGESTLKVILEKKNLSHLIAPRKKKKPPKHWGADARYISMVLNRK